MERLFAKMALCGLLVGFGSAALAHAGTHKPQALVASKPTAADFVGSETCAACHEDISKKFSSNPHWKLALTHGGTGVTCEACHGPGKEHVDGGGDVTKIFQFSKASAKQIDTTCLGCHAAAHPNFERTAHGEARVSCISCHDVHHSTTESGMLKLDQPKLCYGCHTDVKGAFEEPFHHKVNEGLMQCSDCHNPHGTFKTTLLKSSADQNAVCVKCHAETAGPFVYEHPPVKIEGCVSCHTPHGSINARLLTHNNINTLCLQCHTASMNFTAPGVPSFHNQANQYQACTVCHVQIHGSNADSVFFK